MASLLGQGLGYETIRTREWLTRIRRGGYGEGTAPQGDHLAEYLEMIDLTYAQLRKGGVISHSAAAALHGLPVPSSQMHHVQVTRTEARSAFTARHVQVFRAGLDAAEVVVIDGWPVTSLLRTVSDVAACWPLGRAVAAGDAALRAGLGQDDVRDLIRSGRAHPRATRALELLDPLAGSVGESISRVLIAQAGLPEPILQLRFVSADAIDYPDFFWEDFGGVIGEFDGRAKYSLPGRDGAVDPARALYEEKLREDRLRRQVDSFHRWGWPDLFSPDRFLGDLSRSLGYRYRPITLQGIL